VFLVCERVARTNAILSIYIDGEIENICLVDEWLGVTLTSWGASTH
jgi:hypothetical protein